MSEWMNPCYLQYSWVCSTLSFLFLLFLPVVRYHKTPLLNLNREMIKLFSQLVNARSVWWHHGNSPKGVAIIKKTQNVFVSLKMTACLIICSNTRGRHLAISINMGHNELTLLVIRRLWGSVYWLENNQNIFERNEPVKHYCSRCAASYEV